MPRKIELTKDKHCIIDTEDYDLLSEIKWFTIASGDLSYASTNMWVDGKRKTVKLHRYLLGVTDPKQIVDHINGDTLDNRKANLRITDKQGNCQNAKLRKDNKTGYKGVYFRRGRYTAYVRIDGNNRHIKSFMDARSAAECYDDAAIEVFGKYARTNRMLGLL